MGIIKEENIVNNDICSSVSVTILQPLTNCDPMFQLLMTNCVSGS